MKRAVVIALMLLLALSACQRPPEKMVRIAGGEFLAGSSKLGIRDNPERNVAVTDFFIDRNEVTNADYEACVQAGACRKRGAIPPTLSAPELPAVRVGRAAAAAYCGWRGKRLPTENEWERAARGPDNRLYPWGDAFDGDASNGGHAAPCEQNGRLYRFTAPGGCFAHDVSAFGVYDMAGNVAEWTADFYTSSPDLSSPQIDRTQGVIKGGYFYAEPAQLSGAWREPAPLTAAGDRTGFRCAKSID